LLSTLTPDNDNLHTGSSSDMKKDHPVSGSCLCGKVNFEISELNRDVVVCHCKQCRKQTGHLVAATRVNDDSIELNGNEHLTWFAASDDAKRAFCKHCGSVLFWKRNHTDTTSIMAGSLENPTGLKTISHIFTEFKGDYYDITDGLPQYKLSD